MWIMMNRKRATFCFVALLLASLGDARADQERPPPHAERKVISENVLLYHWLEPADMGPEQRVWVLPEVTDWPAGYWGAEVTMTPVPDCCGAKSTSIRWRKSTAITPRAVGSIDPESRYKLDFRFK